MLLGPTAPITNDAVRGCYFTCWRYSNSSTCNASRPRPDLFQPDIFACDDAANGIFRTIKFGGKFLGACFVCLLSLVIVYNY